MTTTSYTRNSTTLTDVTLSKACGDPKATLAKYPDDRPAGVAPSPDPWRSPRRAAFHPESPPPARTLTFGSLAGPTSTHQCRSGAIHLYRALPRSIRHTLYRTMLAMGSPNALLAPTRPPRSCLEMGW